MASVKCIFCAKPVGGNEPMDSCIDCEWIHTVRMQALQEMQFYTDEEVILKQKIKEVQRRRKLAEKRYDDLWDKLLKRLCDRF